MTDQYGSSGQYGGSGTNPHPEQQGWGQPTTASQDGWGQPAPPSQDGWGTQGHQPQAPSFGEPGPQYGSPTPAQASAGGYPDGYAGYPGATGGYPGAAGGYQPPRKKKGMKRIVFGILGLLANGVGLLVMPIMGLLFGAVLAAAGMMSATAVPAPATVALGSTELLVVYTPKGTDASQCSITGTASDMEVTPATSTPLTVTVDGTEYVEAAQVTTASTPSDVTIDCPGADTIAYGTGNVIITLISGGVGLVIPIVLGLLALLLLIWGIIARVRS